VVFPVRDDIGIGEKGEQKLVLQRGEKERGPSPALARRKKEKKQQSTGRPLVCRVRKRVKEG